MRIQRLLTRVGIGMLALGIAPVFAPGSALAAPIPGTPGGVTAVRAPGDPNSIKISWKTTKNATHYSVELFDGITDTVSNLPGNATTLTVDAIHPEHDGRRAVEFSLRTLNQDGRTVLTGSATAEMTS